MADRFPFLRVYKDMASKLNKEDRADFYDAMIEYALDGKEPESSTGAAVFEAARRMIDKWKQTSAAGKASAKSKESVGRSLDGRWTVVGNENPTKEEKNKYINNKNINNKNNNNNKENLSLTREVKERDKTQKGKAKEVVDLFNEVCADLPRVKLLTEPRRHAINARLQDAGPEKIAEVFRKTQASDFLTRRKKTDRKWKADFDWIMEPQHFQRILEGIYDNDNEEEYDAAGTVARQLIESASPEAVRSFEESMNGGRNECSHDSKLAAALRSDECWPARNRDHTKKCSESTTPGSKRNHKAGGMEDLRGTSCEDVPG